MKEKIIIKQIFNKKIFREYLASKKGYWIILKAKKQKFNNIWAETKSNNFEFLCTKWWKIFEHLDQNLKLFLKTL